MSRPMSSRSLTKGMKPRAERSDHRTEVFSRARISDRLELSSGRLERDRSLSDKRISARCKDGIFSVEYSYCNARLLALIESAVLA